MNFIWGCEKVPPDDALYTILFFFKWIILSEVGVWGIYAVYERILILVLQYPLYYHKNMHVDCDTLHFFTQVDVGFAREKTAK